MIVSIPFFEPLFELSLNWANWPILSRIPVDQCPGETIVLSFFVLLEGKRGG